MRVGHRLILLVLGLTFLAAPAAADKKQAAVRFNSAPIPNTALSVANDRCENAILLTCGNILLTGNTNLADNDYNPDSLTSCTGYGASGRDIVYKVNVGVGDSLWIDYTSQADASIYVVRSCDSLSTSCVVGSDKGLPNEPEHLRYKFVHAGTYYIILDSYGFQTGGAYQASGQLVCGPSTPPTNDLCENAPTLPCGAFNVGGSTQFATNNQDFASPGSSCTAALAGGKDVAYRINVNAGDSIFVNYQTSTDGSVYIVSDCADANGSCLAGTDQAGPGGTEHFGYTFDFSGTYYLILDSKDPGSFGTYTATGTIVCPGPAGPVNDVCESAIKLYCGPFSSSGSTQTATNDYTFTDVSCTGFPADGRDVVYRIDASPGDSLWVNYTSTDDASVYLLTNCSSPGTSCLAGKDDDVAGNPEFLRYKFPARTTAYLVLDTYGVNSYGDYTVSGGIVCASPNVDVTPSGRVSRLELRDIYPNPVVNGAAIAYAVPRDQRISLRIFDLQGRVVRTLVDGDVPAGEYNLRWDGADAFGKRLGSGVYFARLTSVDRQVVRRMILSH